VEGLYGEPAGPGQARPTAVHHTADVIPFKLHVGNERNSEGAKLEHAFRAVGLSPQVARIAAHPERRDQRRPVVKILCRRCRRTIARLVEGATSDDRVVARDLNTMSARFAVDRMSDRILFAKRPIQVEISENGRHKYKCKCGATYEYRPETLNEVLRRALAGDRSSFVAGVDLPG
jgi:hypothetical protein